MVEDEKITGRNVLNVFNALSDLWIIRNRCFITNTNNSME